jgi:hypothetical protein
VTRLPAERQRVLGRLSVETRHSVIQTGRTGGCVRGGKTVGAWNCPLASVWRRTYEWVELYCAALLAYTASAATSPCWIFCNKPHACINLRCCSDVRIVQCYGVMSFMPTVRMMGANRECLCYQVREHRIENLHRTSAVLREVKKQMPTMYNCCQAAGVQTDRASGMGIGLSQGCYHRRTTQTQRNSVYTAPNGIRTHDRNVQPIANRCCHRQACLGIILFDKCRL